MTTTFIIKQGDRRPYLFSTLGPLNDAGTVTPGDEQDLTGSAVTFNMKTGAGTVVLDHVPVEVDDAPTGKVHYHWQAGDTDEPGDYLGEFEVVFPDTEPLTFPNGKVGFKIKITPQIA